MLLAAGYPQRAFANVIGNVNGNEFGVAHLYVNISRTGQGTKLDGELHEVPEPLGTFIHNFYHVHLLLPMKTTIKM